MKKAYIRFILWIALALLRHIRLEVVGWKIAGLNDVDGLEGLDEF